MKRRTVKLTESKINRIVKESVYRILNEIGDYNSDNTPLKGDENFKQRKINTNIGTFKIEKIDGKLYAVSDTDDDFYYTLPKQMESAKDAEIQEYLNQIEDSINESSINKVVKNTLNKVLNEIGDTPKGQYMLGRLHKRSSSVGSKPNNRT